MSFYVFTNLAISMDGKISTKDRSLFSLGTKFDHALMDKHRARAHCVLMGADTLRAYKRPVLIKNKRANSTRKRQGERSFERVQWRGILQLRRVVRAGR